MMKANHLENSTSATTSPETDSARSLLDQLLADSRLYKRSKDYKDLLDFVARLRTFAPFNAMLLHVQKPGLSYAASKKDWFKRFGRWIKEGARPLLILQPFSPVALVYDVMDTEGAELPEDVTAFPARGQVREAQIEGFESQLRTKRIDCHWLDAGDFSAGSVRAVPDRYVKDTWQYIININRNHDPAVKFATLAHELGHLFLGHVGQDKFLHIPKRSHLEHSQEELEAESVAYIICGRNGVWSKSHTYLSNFVSENTTVEQIDVYQVMRAAGQIEDILGLVVGKFDADRANKNGRKRLAKKTWSVQNS
jgi:hypothetical protein